MEPSKLKIDGHVHIIGDGSSQSGCWLRPKRASHKALSRIIFREFGLSPREVEGKLDRIYSELVVNYVRESSLDKAVILAHENTYSSSGQLVPEFSSFYVPNDYVLDLSKQYQELLPAVSIHPVRQDALDELDRCIELGAVMMKCLPNCQNINCSERRYRDFWEKMAAAQIPLLAHTGGELSLPVYSKDYADPAILRLPLECGVKVIAAHCGTNSAVFDPDFKDTLAEMIGEFENLYCDNSGMLTPLRSGHFPTIIKEPFHSRMIHGSDLPIPISGRWLRMRGLISAEDFGRLDSIENPLERDFQYKQILGFEPETYTRISSLLPKAALDSK